LVSAKDKKENYKWFELQSYPRLQHVVRSDELDFSVVEPMLYLLVLGRPTMDYINNPEKFL
jgi:hypothetical protein